jgi:ketosteroid isomerase-like protein
MSDIERQVLNALDTYKSAVRARDVEAFMGLYDPDVRIFDTWTTWSYDNAMAWRVAVEGWFSSLGEETVRVTFDDIRVTGDQNFAAMTAIVTYAAVSVQGQELRAMQNRFSWVLKSDNGALRVVHEHTSAPLNIDAKGILAI